MTTLRRIYKGNIDNNAKHDVTLHGLGWQKYTGQNQSFDKTLRDRSKY